MTVILEHAEIHASPVDVVAYLWLPEEELQAKLCEVAEVHYGTARAPRFIVELSVPNTLRQHHIEKIEMIHEPRDLKAENDEIIAESERVMETHSTHESRLDRNPLSRTLTPLYQRLKGL